MDEPTYCRGCGEEIDWRETRCDECRDEAPEAGNPPYEHRCRMWGCGEGERWRPTSLAVQSRDRSR